MFGNGLIQRVILAVCFLLIVGPWAGATQITTGKGEVVSLLYLDVNTALAGTVNGGLFRSVDQGATWARVASIPSCTVKSLAKSSTATVFAASDCGLYKSGDAGVSWTRINSQPGSAVAAASSTVLLGVPGVGIFRSVDGGTTFGDASSGLDSTDIRAISFDPVSAGGIAYAALFNPDWYPSNHSGGTLALGGVFKSADGGISWTNLNSGLSSLWVTGIAVNSAGTVFATTAPPTDPTQGTVQKYSGGAWSGPSFSASNTTGIYGGETVTIDSNGADAWVGSSTQGPHLWIQSSSNPAYNNNLVRQMAGSFTQDPDVLNKIHAIAVFAGAPTLLGVAGLGVYRSASTASPYGGVGYSPWMLPTINVQADRVLSFVRNSNGDAFIGLTNAGVIKAPSGSSTYAEFNAGFIKAGAPSNVHATPSVQYLTSTVAGDVFAAVSSVGVVRSASGSGSWGSLTTPAWSASGLAAVPGNNAVFAAEFYASGSPGVYRVPASGSPTLVQAGWSSGSSMGYVAPSTSGNAQVYALDYDSAGPGAGTNAAGYALSSTGANTPMVPSYVGFQRLGFYAAADNGSTVIAASLKGLFKSTDAGATFSRIATTGLPASGIVGLTMQGGNFYVATRRGDLLCSLDQGVTWQSKLATNAMTVNMVSDGSNLVIITDGAGITTIAASCP